MTPAKIAILLAAALVALALSLLIGGNAGATVTRLPQECSYELAREVCCHPACTVYERRPNPQHAQAQLSICWSSLSCPSASPDVAQFCGCKPVLNPGRP